MDLLAKLDEKEKLFNNIQNQVAQLNNELLMIQGEHRILKELAIEEGLLDEDGRVTSQE